MKATQHTPNSYKKFKENIVVFCLFLASLLSIVILITLLLQILNYNLGYVLLEYTVEEKELFDAPLESIPKPALISTLKTNIRASLLRKLEQDRPLEQLSPEELRDYIHQHILKERIVKSWSLYESLTKKEEIFATANSSKQRVAFHYWFSSRFIFGTQKSDAGETGIRTALLGSIWIIALAVLFSVPFGIATAIYLEEYAKKNYLTSLITTNIYNLAGVPSIIYGLLGLALFVRLLEPLTQGRTILSAGLTLALMCLPMIIINSQEAIRAVPNTLRYSSYALGATRWQTIIYHVLPYSMERIITGIILAVSRAIGETAPLVVVGAATFISLDPKNIYSGFTALPIQIYQWVARPQHIFYNTSSAAIVALLILILLVNTIPISIRNILSKRDKI